MNQAEERLAQLAGQRELYSVYDFGSRVLAALHKQRDAAHIG